MYKFSHREIIHFCYYYIKKTYTCNFKENLINNPYSLSYLYTLIPINIKILNILLYIYK